ncbi:MAG: type II secretion system protein [Candidatus Omnitrophota bacterium]|nr:type II secretion system protein [Candidatus Omnitrophota bacterium]
MKKNRVDFYGFTLVELVIVIVILGILATTALPKFADILTKAKEGADDAVIGALKSAVNAQYAANALNGTKNASGEYWPAVNPFTLLAQSPPHKAYSSSTPDGLTWQVTHEPTYQAYYITCSHYAGSQWGNGTKGRFYIYQYGDAGIWGHKPGDFWVMVDYGH